MATEDGQYVEIRSIGRRKEDGLVRDLNQHYQRLLDLGQIITSEMNMDDLFEIIIDQTNLIMGVDRSTVFLYDAKKDALWSLVATGLRKNEIHIPSDSGIAGWVFQNKTPLVINNAYADSRFNSQIDRLTGYRTEKMVCVPLLNRRKDCIGTLQALNKISGDFENADVDLLAAVSQYVAIALENSKLFDELKVLNKAKERVINHLSHELGTPLSIILGVLSRLSRDLEGENNQKLQKTIERGVRNVNRLLDIKTKIDDILNQRSFVGRESIISIIEYALSFVEELGEDGKGQSAESLLEHVSRRIESLCRGEQVRMERIDLGAFLNEICDEAIWSMGERDIGIVRDFEKGPVLNMDRNILKKVCSGLLKNAIENTPDEGKIEIRAKSGDDWIAILEGFFIRRTRAIILRSSLMNLMPVVQALICSGQKSFLKDSSSWWILIARAVNTYPVTETYAKAALPLAHLLHREESVSLRVEASSQSDSQQGRKMIEILQR
jgi:signal transduction histidine kinase